MNKLGSAWEGMKSITGLKEGSRNKVTLANYNSDHQLAQSLSSFYVRFDVHDFNDKYSEIRNSLLLAPPFLDEQSVIKCFKWC